MINEIPNLSFGTKLFIPGTCTSAQAIKIILLSIFYLLLTSIETFCITGNMDTLRVLVAIGKLWEKYVIYKIFSQNYSFCLLWKRTKYCPLYFSIATTKVLPTSVFIHIFWPNFPKISLQFCTQSIDVM